MFPIFLSLPVLTKPDKSDHERGLIGGEWQAIIGADGECAAGNTAAEARDALLATLLASPPPVENALGEYDLGVSELCDPATDFHVTGCPLANATPRRGAACIAEPDASHARLVETIAFDATSSENADA